MDDDKTLSRLAALLRQAEGTDNPHEADAFLQAAQRLATTASIDLALARAHSDRRAARTGPVQKRVEIGERGTRGLRTYVELFVAIAHANDVTCDVAGDSTAVICYGFADDVAVCESLYGSLAVQMVRACEGYLARGEHRAELVWRRSRGRWVAGPVHGTTARITFQTAFARRVGSRLSEARTAARAEAIARDGARDGARGTELVLRGKQVELREFYRATTSARGTWRGQQPSGVDAASARRAGDRAGRQARLGGERAIGDARRALERGRAG
ncbi:MAG: DUF2786 domain-containing protein [Jatrophihabitans sp.]|nr:MAG: DUF2786 domain-containing protein [Jatrophihabitans sp.]